MPEIWTDTAAESRRATGDMYIGALWPVVDGVIKWGFKVYDPEDEETFPLMLEFFGAKNELTRKNSGKVFLVKTGDLIDIYMDYKYQDWILTTHVALSYAKGRITDPLDPHRTFQTIFGVPVRGVPRNFNPPSWFELFAANFPAILYRRKGDALTLG